MPALITTLSTFAAAYIGGGVVVSTVSFYAVSAALYAGAALGLNALSNLFRPQQQQPKPEDVQAVFRQATPVRTALYGEGVLGGPWVFGGTDNAGYFHRVIALSSRPLTSIDEVWIDDIRNVTMLGVYEDFFDGTGRYVNYDPYTGQQIFIEARLGADVETHYGNLGSNLPEWTTDHRGDGIASLYTRFAPTDPQEIQTLYPNGINTSVRVRAKGVAVYDPADEMQDKDDPQTWTYSDNLARVVLDYMRHADGFRIPDSLILTPLALEGWAQAATDCGDAIPLAGGGSEARYRCWGVYRYDERPADVLSRFMAAGNARLKPVADGGYTLEVGKWREPEVTIDETMIVAFDGLARGKDILQTANTIYSQYTSVPHNFQATDAQPWADEADVSDRGEIPASLDFLNAPSHGQCRRLMKIAAHQANPDEVGTFILNKSGIICFGERFVEIDYPDMDVSGTFEVMDFRFLFGEHGILTGCAITVQTMTEDAYSWDEATEEGTPGGTDSPPASDPFAAPTGFAITMQAGKQVLVEWDAPTSATWTTARIEVENLTAETAPVIFIAPAGDEAVIIEDLEDGDEYRVRMQFFATVSGTAWTAYETDTAFDTV